MLCSLDVIKAAIKTTNARVADKISKINKFHHRVHRDHGEKP